jgi:hypothetical protein
MIFKIGDKVVVNKSYNLERRKHPHYPDLSGKVGTISQVHSTELSVYTVQFDKPFLVGIIDETEKPKSWKPKTTWVFCMHLDKI